MKIDYSYNRTQLQIRAEDEKERMEIAEFRQQFRNEREGEREFVKKYLKDFEEIDEKPTPEIFNFGPLILDTVSKDGYCYEDWISRNLLFELAQGNTVVFDKVN